MRPQKLQVEGFASYRLPTVLDLNGVDFFSLSGATGSGKSSLVDAMIFALYGRVPKLGARAVEPVITAGAERARVALSFEVAGADYTVVRLAQRTKGGGASVKEARLQRGDTVVANGASEVTRAVEDLLRLRFDDFTRTVVLPQGEFARFLTADKAERQALLRSLLGLDIYTAVRALAKTRQSVARDRADTAGARLAALEIPAEDVLASAERRLGHLEGLATEIVEQERRLAELGRTSEEASERVKAVEGQLTRLSEIEPPPRLSELDSLAAEAREKVETSVELARLCVERVANTEAEIAALPTPDAIVAIREAHGRVALLTERLEALDEGSAVERLNRAESAVATATTQLSEARKALEEVRISHSAHMLTQTLRPGEPCPVCDQRVSTVPTRDPLASLTELETAEAAAAITLDESSRSASEARTEITALRSTRAEIAGQLAEAQTAVQDAPSLDELVRIDSTLADAAERLEKAKDELERLEGDKRGAQSELESLSDAIRSVGRELMAAHQAVADLGPPLPTADDPIVQWKEFVSWRDEKLGDVRAVLTRAAEQAEAAENDLIQFEGVIVSDLEKVGVSPEKPYAVSVTRELQVAKAFVAGAGKLLSEKTELEERVKTAGAEEEVAGALAAHLKADGFERWMMAGAIADLVAGANNRLEQLSVGGYSLDSDETGSFSIIDHHNANEVRSVATLSGGETFLVSLALALSLAETLAARGGADLDAIVIDEGFGTLDDESLDTVASVLEDLAGGLMVGVITHVKELAGRAPDRFEVNRDPGGSKVELVS